ncbi:hypothetical protein HBB16_09595 [Pseudonocardia sp. MCCB 268]|nr:hypothetical protein [Pseudonocardia cytotoxica]
MILADDFLVPTSRSRRPRTRSSLRSGCRAGTIPPAGCGPSPRSPAGSRRLRAGRRGTSVAELDDDRRVTAARSASTARAERPHWVPRPPSSTATVSGSIDLTSPVRRAGWLQDPKLPSESARSTWQDAQRPWWSALSAAPTFVPPRQPGAARQEDGQ